MAETKAIDKFADRWRFLPEADAVAGPRSGFCQVLRDRWWVVCPERGLAFFWSKGDRGLGSPQCNSDETISRRLGTTIPGATLKFMPVVFAPVRLEDYR